MKLTKSRLKQLINEQIKRLNEQEGVDPIQNLVDAGTILIFLIKDMADGELKQKLREALDLIERARFKLDDIEDPEDVRRIP